MSFVIEIINIWSFCEERNIYFILYHLGNLKKKTISKHTMNVNSSDFLLEFCTRCFLSRTHQRADIFCTQIKCGRTQLEISDGFRREGMLR
jgi:hypothetical protein